jgi:hypothetical protein
MKPGWDEYRPKVLSQHYQRVDNGEYIAWKALVQGQPETIGIETRADLARLKFKREGLAPADLEAQQQRITLNGITAGWEEEVLAYYAQSDANEQPTVVGKLNTVTYEALTRRLVLVKVNGTPLPIDKSMIEQQLNTIYAQATVSWLVSEEALTVPGIDPKKPG